MLSENNRFLFVHIPKTGGNSIQNILAPLAEDRIVCNTPLQDGTERFELVNDRYPFSKHSTIREYYRWLPDYVFEQLRIFTCIRNPWDRMISYYFSPHRQVSEWSRDAFIDMLNGVENTEHYLHNDYQLDISYLRFERLDHDFKTICRELDIRYTPLPHRNKSRHHNYPEYYDDELVEMVKLKSLFEINTFNYQFGD